MLRSTAQSLEFALFVRVVSSDDSALGVSYEIEDSVTFLALRESGFNFRAAVRDIVALKIDRVVDVLDVPYHI